jgi:hypothetical protein
MEIWNLLSYAAWVCACLIFAWMLMDFLRIRSEYDEDMLLSSREGRDELLEHMSGDGGRHHG